MQYGAQDIRFEMGCDGARYEMRGTRREIRDGTGAVAQKGLDYGRPGVSSIKKQIEKHRMNISGS